MKEAAKKAGDWSKHKVWKYFGAMFMETKNGEQAVSFTRCLGLMLFGQCMYKWGMDVEVTQSMLYTLWGFVGMKGAKDVAGALGKK